MTIFDTSFETFDQDVLAVSSEHPLAGTLRLAKLEVDPGENMKLAGQYLVRGFPTVILFDDGRETGRFSGARSRTQVLSFIRDHVVIAGSV